MVLPYQTLETEEPIHNSVSRTPRTSYILEVCAAGTSFLGVTL